MKLMLALALMAVSSLAFPVFAGAHEMRMGEAKRAAKKHLKADAKWWESKGYSVSSARLGGCEFYSDHKVLCAYYEVIDGDKCGGNYVIHFSSSTKRRIRVSENFFDCGLYS